MSVQGEADYLRRSMLAGAREFLVKPFSSDELTASIRQVYTREQEKQARIAASRPVGRRRHARPSCAPGRRRGRRARPAWSRSSAPRAASAAPRSRSTSRSPRPPSSASERRPRGRLVPVRRRRRPAQPQPQEQVDRGPGPGARGRRARVPRHLPHQPLGRHPGPARPAVARDGRADHAAGIKRMLEALRATHDLVIVDCTSTFNDTTLAILDIADIVLTMLIARDHEHQEHAPLPRGRGAARLRAGQDPARPQPRRLDARASASRTSSTRSGARSTTRSSATVGASSTRSTGACRSSCPTARRRCPRTSCGWPRRSPASRVAAPTGETAAKKAAKKKSCSHGDDVAASNGRRGPKG